MKRWHVGSFVGLSLIAVIVYGAALEPRNPLYWGMIAAALFSCSLFVPGVVRGEDGKLSASKFQCWLWTWVFALSTSRTCRTVDARRNSACKLVGSRVRTPYRCSLYHDFCTISS